MRSKATKALPLPVRHALRKLGHDISIARRRRRMPTALLAERVMTTRPTLAKIERGEPGVAIGLYATALFVLGLVDRLGELASPASDRTGFALDEERLPQRISTGRRKRKAPADGP